MPSLSIGSIPPVLTFDWLITTCMILTYNAVFWWTVFLSGVPLWLIYHFRLTYQHLILTFYWHIPTLSLIMISLFPIYAIAFDWLNPTCPHFWLAYTTCIALTFLTLFSDGLFSFLVSPCDWIITSDWLINILSSLLIGLSPPDPWLW
jgi:hypothetical protein